MCAQPYGIATRPPPGSAPGWTVVVVAAVVGVVVAGAVGAVVVVVVVGVDAGGFGAAAFNWAGLVPVGSFTGPIGLVSR